MSGIDMAINAAQALAPTAIKVSPQWCTKVRNRASSCTACMDACTHEAILAHDNDIMIDADACTGCSACAAACPTEALACTSPQRSELAQQIESVARNSKQIAFCCSSSNMRQADDGRFVEARCLAQLDEALVAHAAINGIEAIALVSGDCRTCTNAAIEHQVDALLDRCTDLIEFWGLPTKVAHKSIFTKIRPSANPDQRRSALHNLAEDAGNVALNTAKQALVKNRDNEPDTLANILPNSKKGLPKRIPPRTAMLLNDLYSLEKQPDKSWHTRLFAQVCIDKNTCSKCGKCAFFCPTGALQFHGTPVRPAVMGVAAQANEPFHTFRACDCVNCGLCAASCGKRALTLGKVNASTLFELEPQCPYLSD